LLDLVLHAVPFLAVGRPFALYRDVRPCLGIFGIELEPLFQSRLGVGLDGFGRAFRLADAAIDAFVRMNDEHVVAFIETVDGTHLDAIHVLAFDAVFDNHIGHESTPAKASPQAKRVLLQAHAGRNPASPISHGGAAQNKCDELPSAPVRAGQERLRPPAHTRRLNGIDSDHVRIRRGASIVFIPRMRRFRRSVRDHPTSKLFIEPARRLGIAAGQPESANFENPDAAIERDRDHIAAFDLAAWRLDPRAIDPHMA
jgi:hypothetical protein